MIFTATNIEEAVLEGSYLESIESLKGRVNTAKLTLAGKAPSTAKYLVSGLVGFVYKNCKDDE